MLRRAIQSTDSFAARIFNRDVMKHIVDGAERLSEKNPTLFSYTFILYCVLGYILLIGSALLLACSPALIGLVFNICATPILEMLCKNSGMPSLRDFHDPTPALFWQALSQNFFGYFMDALPPALVLGVLVLALCKLKQLQTRAPDGLWLLWSEAPQLFTLVNKIMENSGTKTDRILITHEFNCSVVALPKLIGADHYLYIGYPVLACMNVNQLSAILAHEAAHLTMQHSQLQTVAQRQRLMWLEQMRRWREKLPLLYLPFNLLCFWYMPIFNALAFVRSKQQEFQADATARRLCNTDEYAKALLSFVLKGDAFAEAFSKRLAESALATGSHDTNIFKDAIAACNQATESDALGAWKKYRLNDDDLMQTHPCLVRRLRRLELIPESESWQPDWNEILQNDSAKAIALLGEASERIDQRLCAAFASEKMTHNVARTDAFLLRAIAHYKAGRLDEALSDLDECIKLNPLSAEAIISRSTILMDKQEFGRALEDIDRALQLKPGDLTALSNRLELHILTERWAECVLDCTSILSTSPDNVPVYMYRIMANHKLNKHDLVLADCDELARTEANRTDGLTLRAYYEAELGNLEKARVDFYESLKLPPPTGFVLPSRAYVAVLFEEWTQSAMDAEAAIKLGINDSTLLSNYARALHELGRNEEALPIIEKLLAEERDPFVLANRARVLHGLGRNDEALKDIEEALAAESHEEWVLVKSKICEAAITA